ncbi:DNA-directed RNA polymerase subunit delta [Bacillus infantis]|uniref:DNA-directed RNA polymerase subunit delta n=1 Tax=Bacillus infantis TaxID=324767 RepID=UPI002154FCDF|nr:DNA-directed RNA polymerase subunit delta [Bacillus infantis]
MSLDQFTKEELQEMSFIDIAYELLKGTKQQVSFTDIINEYKTRLEVSDEEIRSRIAQFYTDLNLDGRFIAMGENRWGLRSWYPVDTMEEETMTAAKPKKKKAKKAAKTEDVDLDLDEYDELDEEDIEYDDLDDDDDDLDEDDDDLLEDDLDEDSDDDFEDDDDELLEDDLDEDEELDEDDEELDEDEEDL